METIEKCIDVNVPVSTVYNQWTQFEEFPRFMENIESVNRLVRRQRSGAQRHGLVQPH